MEEEISPLRGEAGEARRQRQLTEITEAFAVLARVQRELGPILNSAQRFIIATQAREHDSALERGND